MELDNVNFSGAIRVIRDDFSKMMLTLFYSQILPLYYNMEEKLEVAFNATPNRELNEDTLHLFIEALAEFDCDIVKEMFNSFPVSVSNEYLKMEDSFFLQNYPALKPILLRYHPSEVQVQNARNSLYSFTRMFQQDVMEIERAGRTIINYLNQINDNSSTIRSGVSGGVIGGAIGSLLLPGLGTIAGGFLGGMFMGKDRMDNIINQIVDPVNLYIQHARKIIHLLGINSKELYMIFGRIYDEFFVKRMRNVYMDAQKSFPNVNAMFVEYYHNESAELKAFFSQKVDEDPESLTWGQISAHVYEFIRVENS